MNPPPPNACDRLLIAWCQRRLDAERPLAGPLWRLIQRRPAARDACDRLTRLHGRLRDAGAAERGIAAASFTPTGPPPHPRTEPIAFPRWRRAGSAAAAAAVVAVGVGLSYLALTPARPQPPRDAGFNPFALLEADPRLPAALERDARRVRRVAAVTGRTFAEIELAHPAVLARLDAPLRLEARRLETDLRAVWADVQQQLHADALARAVRPPQDS